MTNNIYRLLLITITYTFILSGCATVRAQNAAEESRLEKIRDYVFEGDLETTIGKFKHFMAFKGKTLVRKTDRLHVDGDVYRINEIDDTHFQLIDIRSGLFSKSGVRATSRKTQFIETLSPGFNAEMDAHWDSVFSTSKAKGN